MPIYEGKHKWEKNIYKNKVFLGTSNSFVLFFIFHWSLQVLLFVLHSFFLHYSLYIYLKWRKSKLLSNWIFLAIFFAMIRDFFNLNFKIFFFGSKLRHCGLKKQKKSFLFGLKDKLNLNWFLRDYSILLFYCYKNQCFIYFYKRKIRYL